MRAKKKYDQIDHVSPSSLLRYVYVDTMPVYSFDCYVDESAKSYFARILEINSS